MLIYFIAVLLAGLLAIPTLGSFLDRAEPHDALIGLAVTCFYVVGTFFFFLALENSTPIATAVFSYLEVPIAAVAALYFFNEEFSARSITGIILILTGAVLVSLDQARHAKHQLPGIEAIP